MKKQRRNWRHEYQGCVYYECETGECCNGVEEGTECLGLYNEKCGGYEPDDWYWWTGKYIELERQDYVFTDPHDLTRKERDYVNTFKCPAEKYDWDRRRDNCDGLNFQMCKDCTRSENATEKRILEQRKLI